MAYKGSRLNFLWKKTKQKQEQALRPMYAFLCKGASHVDDKNTIVYYGTKSYPPHSTVQFIVLLIKEAVVFFGITIVLSE